MRFAAPRRHLLWLLYYSVRSQNSRIVRLRSVGWAAATESERSIAGKHIPAESSQSGLSCVAEVRKAEEILDAPQE